MNQQRLPLDINLNRNAKDCVLAIAGSIVILAMLITLKSISKCVIK
jgi:hypothetical protein